MRREEGREKEGGVGRGERGADGRGGGEREGQRGEVGEWRGERRTEERGGDEEGQ